MNKTLIRITALIGALSIGTFGAYAANGSEAAVSSDDAAGKRPGIVSEDSHFKGGKHFGRLGANGTVYTCTIDAETGDVLEQDSKELSAESDGTAVKTGKTALGRKSGKGDSASDDEKTDQPERREAAEGPGTDGAGPDSGEPGTDNAGDESSAPDKGDKNDPAEAERREESEAGRRGKSGTSDESSDSAETGSTDQAESRLKGGKDRSDSGSEESSDLMSRADVTEIALREAGVSADQAQVRVRLTQDEGKAVYKVTVFVPADA